MALPKVGETISAKEFNRIPKVGETISADQFNQLGAAPVKKNTIGERFVADVFSKDVNTGERIKQPGATGGAIAETGLDVGIGFGKGAAQTALEVPKKVTQIAETKGTIQQAKTGAKGIEDLQAMSNRLVQADSTFEQGDPRKQQLREANKELQQQINLVSRGLPTTNTPLTDEAFKVLDPTNKAQKFGFGLEKVGEFIVGGKAADSLIKGVTTGGLGRARGLNQLNTGGKFLEKAFRPLASLNKARRAGELNKVGKLVTAVGNITAKGGANAVIDGIIAGGQDKDVKTAAITGGVFSGAFGVFDELRQFTGGFLTRAAEKLYQKGLKPSTSLGSERQKQVVKTGLEEGIVLSEAGMRKTASALDELETALGKAIDNAPPGTVIETSKLKTFTDGAKKVLANTTDIAESRKAKKAIDSLYREFKKKHGKSVEIKLAQELKKNTYKWLRNSYDKLSTPVKEGNKQLARGLREGIIEVAPVVDGINKRLASLYKFDEALERSSSRIGNLNIFGLGTKVLSSGVQGKLGASLAFVNQFLGAPSVKTFGAIKMNRLAKIIGGLDKGTAQQVLSQLSETVRADVIRRLSKND